MNININSVSSAIDSPIELRKMSNQAAEKGCDILGVMAPSTPMPNMTSTVVNSGKVEMGADARSFESELKSKAELAKANLTTLFNKLTTTDIKALDEENMGSLTDKEVDKVVNVVEEIKIMLAAYCKDYIPTGNVDIDEIKEVTGNAGMAAKVIKKFHASNIPATKDNVLDAMEAVKELKNIDKIDTNVKRFLIRNNMDPTIDNIYKASHSVSDGAPRDNISDEDLSKLNTQIEDIIRDSGLEANEANKNNAKLILKEGACLNTESLMLAKEIDDTNVNKDEDEIIDIVVDAMIEGKKAIDAKLTDDTSMKDIAIESYNVIKNAKASDIIRITNELLELNISNLRANVGDTAYRSENEEGYVKNFAALEHARLTLSAGALFTMEKLGVKLDNTAITDLTCTYEKLEISTSSVINELKDTPINALGITYVKASFSIDDITKAGALVKWKAMVANETYETFGTQIRSDLGDNLRKAVNASADNILDELGYEKNKENRAAVNILAANSMELSTQNIDKMADDYKTVMNIATNLSPRMVMDMIREKINPLTSDVHLLNEYVDRYDKGDEERDSYAKFLYKLEVSGAISDEERADYIGIYRVLNNIAKDEGKSIGATVKAGENLVLENVIKHYISRRHGKVDAKIGDESGYSAGDGNMSYYTKIFRECVNLEDKPLDNSYYERELENINRAANAEADVIRVLTDNDEPVTISNVIAALDFKGNKIYRRLEEIDSIDIKKVIEDIYSTSEDEEALSTNLDKLYEDVERYRESSMNEDTLSYGKIKDLDEMIRNVGLLRDLAKKKEYKIPVYDNGKLVNINLKLVTGEAQGKMNITFEHEKYGNVSINCNTTKTHFDALLTSDSENGAATISERHESLTKAIESIGYKEVSLNISTSKIQSSLREMDEGKGSSTMMYKAARAIIFSLIQT